MSSTAPQLRNLVRDIRDAALNGQDQLQGETYDCPPPVGRDPREWGTEAELNDVISRMRITVADRAIVQQAYQQACNTVKLYSLQKKSALVMDDRALADQFEGALRRAALAVLTMEDAYPWLRDEDIAQS